MILRPPRSTLFPYTTLFFFNDTATTEIYTLYLHDALPIWQTHTHEILQDILVVAAWAARGLRSPHCHAPRTASYGFAHSFKCRPPDSCDRRVAVRGARSEEHTSELQSLRHLVCRLLLVTNK